tara:strand:- start:37 stop:1338 length:1302 start_codon:yes stop_codon:yes gene_type:complete
MKTTILTFALVTFGFTNAQDTDQATKTDYNKWSVELNAGLNKPEKPYTIGYFSSDPSKSFNFKGIEHIDLGVRYMFSTTFGAKVDLGYDIMQNQSGTTSLPFETKQYRIGLQGVVNMGRMLQFETFTERFGLLLHGGLQLSQLAPQTGVNKDKTEKNGGYILGLTPQIRISNKIVLTGDFSYLGNVRQHFAWDGNYSEESNNLAGSLFNTSLGLTLYLGKNSKHADWTFAEESTLNDATDKVAQKRIDEIETLMNDTDKDGVPDYLDAQNNTPNGVFVDTKGRFLDANKNGTPDELETRNSSKDGESMARASKEEEAFKSLVENGYVNIFFDVNKDMPNSGSTNNVYYIIRFLNEYPDAVAIFKGYADSRGNEAANLELSKQRAQNIYNTIVSSGIDSSRVSIQANGVDTTFTEDSNIGLDLARRVSIQLIKQ